MSGDLEWYVNGAFRLRLSEVAAISVLSGATENSISVYLRGVAAPLIIPGTPAGTAELLRALDDHRFGGPLRPARLEAAEDRIAVLKELLADARRNMVGINFCDRTKEDYDALKARIAEALK